MTKNELLQFFMMNPLKGSKKRTLAKNYHFPIYRVFLESKKPILVDLPPASMNIRLFRNKYYIKTPKNH